MSGVMSKVDEDSDEPVQAKFYLNLPRLPIGKTKGDGRVEVLSEEVTFRFISSRSVSTYPMVEQIPGKRQRDGDPNADTFAAVVHQNRAVVAIADGCSWGIKPYRAARNAVQGVSSYVTTHDEPLKDVREAGRMLLRGMCEANNHIFANAKDTWDAGTTTLLCSCVVQLETPGDWGVIVCGVGDCKALQWSESRNKIIDITSGQRSLDLRDPGGRLGPYSSLGVPDLRNLSLHYVTAKEGDLIILATDGVYDNLDPVQLGYDCKDLGLGDRSWKELSKEELAHGKAQFLRRYLKGLLKGKQPTPEVVVNTMVENAISVTEKVRNYMETTGKKQPANTKLFPGKMDHTTAIAFLVGEHEDLNTCGKYYKAGLSANKGGACTSASASSDDRVTV